MKKEKKSVRELAVFEEIRKSDIVTAEDAEKMKVPMSMVFGHGTTGNLPSFGNKTLNENSQLVDAALKNVGELENIFYIAGVGAAAVLALVAYFTVGVQSGGIEQEISKRLLAQPYVNPQMEKIEQSHTSFTIEGTQGGVLEYESGSKLTFLTSRSGYINIHRRACLQ